MFERRSLKWPITLGVTMIVLLILLTAGWILLSVFGALADDQRASFYWILLSVGTPLLVLVLAGVIVYLSLTVKAVNLNRRQSNFIDSVTHELKSPIASLKLYLQTLHRRQLTRVEQESFCRFMLEDVERLDALINHLLDAARLDKQAVETELEDVDLAALLRHCAESVCLQYRVSPTTIGLQLRPCTVHARPVDLDMLFRNLLDNAIKYAGKPPQVEICLERASDGQAVVRISDNGQGIPHHLRRKIFGRFVRLGLELERDKPGTGLGLYIVGTLIKRLRGRLRVRDRDGEPGTIFEVQLPARSVSWERAGSSSGDENSRTEVA